MSFSRNFKFGSKWEDEVEKYLRSKGYTAIYCEPNPDYNNRQVIIIAGKDYCHPDFTVGIKEEGIFFKKFLLEVKSFTKLYQNQGLIDPWEFPQDELYVTVELAKFDQYQFVSEFFDLQTRIIFISENFPNIWYWDTLERLSRNLRSVSNVYGKRAQRHYLWNVKDLKQMLIS